MSIILRPAGGLQGCPAGALARLGGSSQWRGVVTDGRLWRVGSREKWPILHERGAIQGFNVPQRVLITTEPAPGQRYTIALLAVNGPLGEPGGAVFVRYAFLACEWRTPG
jgi:hypothetical protein